MTGHDSIINRVRAILTNPRYLAPIIGVLGSLGVAANWFISNPFAAVFPVAIVIAVIVYYVTQKGYMKGEFHFPADKRVIYALYFCALAALTITFQIVGNDRTVLVYILTLLLYMLTIIVMYTQPTRYGLLTIFLTGVVHRATMVFNSEVILGNDSLFHNRMARQIAIEGTRSPLAEANSKYFDVPLYHIEAALSSLLMNLPIQETTFLILSASYVVIPGTVVFLLGRQFGSNQTGLFASLLFISADFPLGWSVQPQATSMGLILFSVLALLTIKYLRQPHSRYFIVFALVFISLALTHHISVFVTGVAITLLIISYQIVKPQKGGFQIMVFIWLTIGGVWAFDRYFGPGPRSIDFLTLTGSSVIARLSTLGLFDSGSSTQTIDINATLPGSASLDVIHVVGSGLLVLFGVVGFLLLLKRVGSGELQEIFATGTAIGVLFIGAFAGPLVGFRFFQPLRWFQFIYVLLTPLAGIGLVSVVKSVGHRSISMIIMTVITLTIISLMGGTFIGALDEPVFDKANGAQQFAVEEQNNELYRHVTETRSQQVGVTGDSLAMVVLSRHYEEPASMYRLKQGEDRVEIVGPELLIKRPYVQTNHVSFNYATESRSFRVIGSLPKGALNCRSGNRVYHSGTEKDTKYSIEYIRTRC